MTTRRRQRPRRGRRPGVGRWPLKAGAFYSFRGERIGQGRDKASAYVAEHPEIAEEVRGLLLEARKAENAALGAPVTPPATQAQAA